jgi:hypothetical protein
VKCLVSYLRSKGIQEDLLSSVDTIPISPSCLQTIDNTINTILPQSVFEKDRQSSFKDCMINQIELTGLKTVYLISQALKSYDVEWKVWQLFSLEKRFNELVGVFNEGRKPVFKTCQEETQKSHYRNLFAKLFVKDSYPKEQEYCIRKNLVENGVLNPYEYKMDINPQNVDENTVSCTSSIQSMKSQVYNSLKITKCEIDSFRNQLYHEYMMKVAIVLPQLNLSQKEIEIEREKYVEKMIEIKENAEKVCGLSFD